MKSYTNITTLIAELEKVLQKKDTVDQKIWTRLVGKYRMDDNSIASKNFILDYIKRNKIIVKEEVLEVIKMKPTRTISGVTPITIFTKPYQCSGNCIFCPTYENTPKSYLAEEPGIQRALSLKYNPYDQIKLRIKALEAIGHNTDKIELIISGGTWDDYELNYRIWYILEAFRALNGEKSKEYSNETNYLKEIPFLKKLQEENSLTKYRNIGMSIETRPDKINEENIRWYRIFGVTKVQLGIQTLNEKVLEKNTRGHNAKKSYEAVDLLRHAGFKIHIHWMCNLFSSTPRLDYIDFKKVFSKQSIQPDEIKIYPCSIVKNTKLYQMFFEKKYSPYSKETLISLLSRCKELVPRYCRINRLFRDIPSDLIVAGNKSTNLRQEIQAYMLQNSKICKCIRCREVKEDKLMELRYKVTRYKTNVSDEYFLEYITKTDKLAGFLRLSIYKKKSLLVNTKAMIREVHVYGTSLNLSSKSSKSRQHSGLGTQLLQKAEEIAKKEKSNNIAVISAVGTRNYYKKRGYVIEKNYGYALKNL